MNELDYIKINFSENQIGLLNFCLAFIMFGVALDVEKSHFATLIQRPKSLLIGLSAQYILLPILTILLVFILNPNPAIIAGMLLIASCPGGNVSSYATHLAKANVALSIVLTMISSLTCVITTPFIFSITSFIFHDLSLQNFKISFFDMVSSMSKIVLIPLIAGLLVKKYFLKLADLVLPYIKKLSFIIFIGFIMAAVLGNLDNLFKHLHIVFFIVIIHNTLALLGGYFYSKLMKVSEKDARTISIEVGIQNSGLALVLVFAFFNGNGGMSLIAAWWSIWHLISALGLAKYWNWRDGKL
jgi:bile acid:Na+ symporter, BASS family